MEKRSYETYEFLASTNSDSDSNQFFVLQDDGTVIAVNKELHISGNLAPAESGPPEFDVPSQEYYVEFERNAAEIMTLNDQFAIPNGENNVFTNSYLIQPGNASTVQQMETETFIDPQTLDAHQLQQLNVEAFNGSKQTTDLTEITLTDEQYQNLEQRGWLLLESNNKIFVLNTLGLHDITDNEKLIERLKNELQETTNTDSTIGQLKVESISSYEVGDVSEEQGSVVEYFIANNVPVRQLAAADNEHYILPDDVAGGTSKVASRQLDAPKTEIQEPSETNETKIVTEVPVSYELRNKAGVNSENDLKKCDSIKVKTKYIFKDIPEKIYLGKTVNGKRLIAKVRKKIKETQSNKIDKKPQNSSQLEGSIFTHLIQESFRSLPKASAKHVAYAEAVMSQLLRLPNMKQSILENNLVITKACEGEDGRYMGQPTMVTGTVQSLNGREAFIHSPLLLLELLNEADAKSKNPSEISGCPEEKTARGFVDLLHIHISETKHTGKPAETSINLSERKLPLDILYDAKKRHPNPSYACGTCGAIFKSESELKEHQDDECIDVEDELTIDTDDFNTNITTLYTVTGNGKDKVYTCTICETKFSRLFNCKKHIKAHKAGIEKKLKAYICKMCPNTYFHSSTLSKHIVKMHIQTQLD